MIDDLRKYLFELKKLDAETQVGEPQKCHLASNEVKYEKIRFEVIETRKMTIETTVKKINGNEHRR